MNILFFDLETTGIKPKDNSVIQIAAEFHQDGELISSFNKKLVPLLGVDKISIGAMGVNGSRFSELFSRNSRQEVTRAFADFLADCKSKAGYSPILPCGQNVSFDINFIKPLLESEGIVGFEEVISHKIIDTSTIANFLIQAGKIDLEKYNLQKLAEYFEVDTIEEGEDALVNASYHDAAYDVRMTAKVYYAMIDLIKG